MNKALNIEKFEVTKFPQQNSTEVNISMLFKTPPKILLLEDIKLIQALHRTLLTELGCTDNVASTREEALVCLFARSRSPILIDVDQGDQVLDYIAV